MLKYIKLFFYFFIFITSLYGAEINTTIVDGNSTIYKSLLKSLNKDSNISEDQSLEKTLLTELVDFNQTTIFKPKKIEVAKDLKTYRKLFIDYINDIHKITDLKKKLDIVQKKIKTIESEIKTLDNNNSRLLSFQLQDSFYRKQANIYKNSIKKFNDEIKLVESTIKNSIKNLYFNIDELEKEFAKEEKIVQQKRELISKLQINIEQAKLINNSRELRRVERELKEVNKHYIEDTTKLLSTHFMIFSFYLKAKSNKTFAIEKKFYSIALKYNILTQNEINSYTAPFLLSLEKAYIGQIKTLAGASKQEAKEVIKSTWDLVNKPLFFINKTPISPFKIVLSLMVFILGFIIGSLYKRKINKIATRKSSFTASTRTMVANLGYYFIVIIAFFVALKTLGVTLSSIAIVAGALSVGIGFGLQNVVANFVSGLILMFERSIKIGDYIEVADHRGHVTDIRMRSTTIKTNDNIDIIIPNQSFVQNNLINWTMNDKIRRFNIPFGVAYGTDAHKVMQVVKDAVMQSDYNKYIIDTPTYETRVIMTEMADSSVNFELLIWLAGADKIEKPKRLTSHFLIIIYDTLNANNIEIPFPQQDIHIRSVDKNIPIKIDVEAK